MMIKLHDMLPRWFVTMDELPTWIRIAAIVSLSFIAIAGIVLNAFVLLTKTQTMGLRGNHFISTLSCCDLFTSVVTIPLTIASLIVSARERVLFCVMCEAAKMFTIVSTMGTITCVSVDRYNSIVVPMRRTLNSDVIKTLRIIVALLSAIGVALPFASIAHYKNGINFANVSSCRCLVYTIYDNNLYEFYAAIFYMLASVTIIECYVNIIKIVWKKTAVNVVYSNDSMAKTKTQKRKKIIKLSVAIVSSVVFVWTPFMVLSLMRIFINETTTSQVLYILFNTLAFTSVIWNPLLYTFVHSTSRIFCKLGKNTVHPSGSAAVPSSTSVAVENAFNISVISQAPTMHHLEVPKVRTITSTPLV